MIALLATAHGIFFMSMFMLLGKAAQPGCTWHNHSESAHPRPLTHYHP
jgi:hypothetical protein